MREKRMKRIVSLVLSCILLSSAVTSTSVKSLAAADTAYKELTFRDWGFENTKKAASGITRWSSLTPITSWNKVAISGKIKFETSDTSSWIRIGTDTASSNWNGLSIRPDGSGNLIVEDPTGSVYGIGWAPLCSYTAGTVVPFRVTFDENSTGGLEMKFTVGDGSEVTKTIAKDKVGNLKFGIQLNGAGGNTVTAISTEANYEELTFRDWGFGDEKSVTGTTAWSSQTPITSWDNVAIHGEIKFSSNNTNSWIRIGTDTESENWDGFCIRPDGGGNLVVEDPTNKFGPFSNTLYWSYFASSYTTGTSVPISLIFTKLYSGQLLIEVVSNDTLKASVILSQEKLAKLNLGLQVNATSGNTVTVTSTAEPVIEYNELTFRDWGFGDEKSVSGTTAWSSKTPISTWNKVAISGEIKFATSNTNSWIRIGTDTASSNWNGISIRPDGSGNLVVEDPTGSAYGIGWAYLCSYTEGTAVPFRVAFVENATGGLDIEFKVNNGNTVTKTISQTKVGNLKFGLQVNAATGNTVTVTSTAEPVIEYNELTFSDWGFGDEKSVSGTTAWSSKTPISTWNQVAISGEIKFATSNTNSWIRIGTDTASSNWNGLSIRPDGSGNLIVEDPTGSAYGIGWAYLCSYTEGTAVPFRVAFTENVTGGLDMEFKVNNGNTVTKTISQTKVGNLKFGLQVNAATGNTVTVTSTAEPVIEYNELTFRDWGLNDQSAMGAATIWSTKVPINTWEDVAISGEVAFAVDESNSWIRIGTDTASGNWNGLSIRPAGGMLIVEEPMTGTYGFGWKRLCSFTAGETMSFRAIFSKTSTGALDIGFTVNDSSIVTITIPQEKVANLKFGMQLNVASGNTITLTSTSGASDDSIDTPEEPIKKPQDISEYTMISFKDFGINDREVKGITVNCIKTVDLHEKVFKGKITFPSDTTDPMNGILTFGGTSESEWFGLRVGVADNGGLYIYEAVNGANPWNISPDTFEMQDGIRGKEIELAITFYCVDEKNVYVGVYVNDIFCGEKYYQNLQHEFGKRIMIYSAGAPIKICSSDTPWMKFLKSDVKLEYFGFSTENWKKELEDICK